MSFTLNRVTEFSRVPGTTEVRIVAEHPYVRLKGPGAEAPIYLQEGAAWSEGGDQYSLAALPEWFWLEMHKCSQASLAAAGWYERTAPPEVPRLEEPWPDSSPWRDDEEPASPEVSTAALLAELAALRAEVQRLREAPARGQPKARGAKRWTCDECGKEMSAHAKAFHRANHRRHAEALVTRGG